MPDAKIAALPKWWRDRTLVFLYTILGILAVVLIFLVYSIRPSTTLNLSNSTVAPSPNLYGSNTNPIAFGNWKTSVGVNWWGPGYYITSTGSMTYESSECQLIENSAFWC